MSAVVTIRNVPDDVRQLLAGQAQERGQSLQSFLLGILARQAAFSRNQQLLADIERDLSGGGGAGADAPDAARLIDEARAEGKSGGGRPADDVA